MVKEALVYTEHLWSPMFKKLKKEPVKPADNSAPGGNTPKKPPPSNSSGEIQQTVIDEPITVDGTIQGEENLILEGSMKGKVELEKHIFTVGPKGRFDGEVYARDVVVKGSLKGSINAINNLRISKDADFFGEAKIKTISIEGGALVKGVFEIARKPAARAAASARKAKPDKPAEVDPGRKSVKPTEPANPEANRQAAQPSPHSLKGN